MMIERWFLGFNLGELLGRLSFFWGIFSLLGREFMETIQLLNENLPCGAEFVQQSQVHVCI
jgi:hypothetical protein